MIVKIIIECECGNNETVIAKNTFQEFEGSNNFRVSQSQPEVKNVECLKCKQRHEII